MFRSLGTTELLIIAAVVILLFGGRKIPELFKGLAEAVKEFKKSSKDTPGEKKEEQVWYIPLTWYFLPECNIVAGGHLSLSDRYPQFRSCLYFTNGRMLLPWTT